MMNYQTILKNILLAFGVMVVAGFALGCGDDTPEPPGLMLLFTSDEHSHMFAFSPELDDYPMATTAGDGALVGGIARRAVVLEEQRAAAAEKGYAVLTVSAGDVVMGGLPHIAWEAEGPDYLVMADLGYDVVNLGNHEFDFGPAVPASAIEVAVAAGKMPQLVASNIHFDGEDTGDDTLEALYSDDVTDDAPIHPYAVITMENELKVGVIGFMGVDAAFVAPYKSPVRFSGPLDEDEGDKEVVLPLIYADLQPIVDKLRNEEEVDLVVGLGHSGLGDDLSEDAILESEDYQICANVTGLDLIISGHSHHTDATPVIVDQDGGGECVVLNGGAYGAQVGRIEYVFEEDQPLAWDDTTQTLLAVDDTTVPDPEFAAVLDGFVDIVEASGSGATSFLEDLVSRIEGTTVSDDTGTSGDLYFHILGDTSFDVTDDMMLNYLSADTMLAVTDELGIHTDMGLESAGVIRLGLVAGETGDISLADAFNIVPLGNSPVDGSLGYPLLRVNVITLELRAIFEFAATQGPTNSDFRLGQSGIRITYDKTRPPALSTMDLLDPTKGWVMKMELDTDHADGFEQYDRVIYDRDEGIDTSELFSVVSSSYVAEFAATVGVTLRDDDGNQITIPDAILHRGDSSEVKQLEAFMAYIKAVGTLPELYDMESGSKTEREICLAGCD